MKANPNAFPMNEKRNRLVGDLPKIGIRPCIDGRRGRKMVREGLEEQTMGMALSAKALIEAGWPNPPPARRNSAGRAWAYPLR